MKLAQLDRHNDYSLGAGPLALAVQTLDTLTRSPRITWEPSQHAAACKVVADARRLLESDVLNVMASDDTDYAPLDPLPEARTERPQTVYADLNLRGEGVDLRSVAQAVAGAVPAGTDVRLSVGDGYEWKPAK